MRQTILVIACVAAVVLGSCKYRGPGAQTETATETIKATKAPEPPKTSTDDPLTQTVEITDTRSEAEGGVLTEKSPVKTDSSVAGERKTAATKQKAAGRKQK